jgi:Na+-driven multidrug efflux pump
MTAQISLMAIIMILFIAFSTQSVKALKASRDNNYLAVRYRNFAILYGFLCIIFTVALLLSVDEFISINQFNNCPMDEQINAISTHYACPWAVYGHGHTVARVLNVNNQAGIFLVMNLLFNKHVIRVKAIRYKDGKVIITRTYVVRNLPTVELYLS